MTPRLSVVVPVAREGIASPLPRIVAIVRALEPLSELIVADRSGAAGDLPADPLVRPEAPGSDPRSEPVLRRGEPILAFRKR